MSDHWQLIGSAATDWGRLYDELAAADSQSDLAAEELQQFAVAAYLTGHDAESIRVWTRAQQAYLKSDATRAARCAFWIGMLLATRGEMAGANGWFGRARRCVEGADCVEQGYLLLPAALGSLNQGAASKALGIFSDAVVTADRFEDLDLAAMARLGQGQALVARGEVAEGIALLDEVMVSVQAGEVSPIPTGMIYCAVVEVCHATFDLQRAGEWTTVLDAWCDTQQGLVPYRGQCLVHRSQILQSQGSWPEALEEAERACRRLAEPADQPAIGAAYYQRAELYRLFGKDLDAERDYRQASHWGHMPQPGLALLRLQQGDRSAAHATIRRVLHERTQCLDRAHILSAAVDIFLAVDEVQAANAVADELRDLARDARSPRLEAVSGHADGAVLLAEGRGLRAMAALRSACTRWQSLGNDFEAARVRSLIGVACHMLDDHDGAGMAFEEATAAFRHLGAAPQLRRLAQLRPTEARDTSAGLSAREVEVLKLVATGKSNQQIAAELTISSHTAARHLQNIYRKLDVGSRTAAAAYAFEHKLA